MKSIGARKSQCADITMDITCIYFLLLMEYLLNIHSCQGVLMTQIPLLVAAGSIIYADSAYTNYAIEEYVKRRWKYWSACSQEIEFKKKARTIYWIFNLHIEEKNRNNVQWNIKFFPEEDPFHTVTEFGFILKVVIFIFGYAISKTYISSNLS